MADSMDEKHGTSDEYVDPYCDPCFEGKGLNIKAYGYCKDCFQFLCSDCHVFHGKFQVAKNHAILRGSSMPQSQADKPPRFHHCDDHPALVKDQAPRRFMTAKRDPEEAKKKYFNLKQRCKEKIDRIRRAMKQTGGGPPPPELTPAEQLLWKSMSERPVMKGLSVTIDTDATTELATPAEIESSTSSSRNENSQGNTAESDGEQLSLSSEVTNSKIKKRKSQQVLTMVNTEKDTERIELETKKIQKEIEKMDKEVEVLISKKAKLEMEKDKIKSERELYEFQKIYYQLKIEKEFGVILQSEQ